MPDLDVEQVGEQTQLPTDTRMHYLHLEAVVPICMVWDVYQSPVDGKERICTATLDPDEVECEQCIEILKRHS